MTQEELEHYLQWMFSYGIIDSKQYQELLLKSLPYLKR
jgi:hypothetical protein